MSGSSQQQSYGDAAWGPAGPHGRHEGSSRWGYGSAERQWHGGGPWGPGPWAWNPRAGRVLPIVAMVLGFIVFWPVGLAILGYNLWSGRMTCWGRRHHAERSGERGYGAPPWARGQGGQAPWSLWRDWCQGTGRPASSGNHAFDEYRAETLRRLEEEQQEFSAFLERLRFARDKSEFDQFMNERRTRPASDQPPAEGEGRS